jgi:hypothetical protein
VVGDDEGLRVGTGFCSHLNDETSRIRYYTLGSSYSVLLNQSLLEYCLSITWNISHASASFSKSVAVLPFAVDFYIFLALDAVRTWRFCTFPKTLHNFGTDLTWPLLNSMPVAVGGCF